MIASIEGRVLARQGDSLVVALGGMGVKVHVPTSLAAQARPGEPIYLHTHLHVREQELALYLSLIHI
jgi:Holliday junction DNA helicase RuvA